jgi:hypothetical protein
MCLHKMISTGQTQQNNVSCKVLSLFPDSPSISSGTTALDGFIFNASNSIPMNSSTFGTKSKVEENGPSL